MTLNTMADTFHSKINS